MEIRSINENMGNADRVIRTLLAITFVLAFFNHLITGAIGVGLLAVSVAFLATAIFGKCPLYSLIGLRTNMKDNFSH